MPYTNCQILITRGKNVGKACGEVNKKCRHIQKQCILCGKTYSRDTVYSAHAKKCTINAEQFSRIEFLLTKKLYKKLEDKAAAVATAVAATAPTTITNINTINNINIYQTVAINEVGAFKALCDKMGVSEATDFLCDLASKPLVMPLFEKLYLEGDPASLPIANNNGKDFVYRDSNDELVHDVGGNKIAKLGERLLKNAFVEATDPLIVRFMGKNEGEQDGDDVDYDKFIELQNGATSVRPDKAFIKELYPKTYNPGHSFFAGALLERHKACLEP
jgi:hypothetical protein